MVLVVGNVSATEGRLWYHPGKLGRTERSQLGARHRGSIGLVCFDRRYQSNLLRFIQLFAVLLKRSGLGVVMASKSTNCYTANRGHKQSMVNKRTVTQDAETYKSKLTGL